MIADFSHCYLCRRRHKVALIAEPNLIFGSRFLRRKSVCGMEISMASLNCDSCVYYVYDEEDECYYCEVDMDEDDAARMMQGHYKGCPYYQLDDEYAVVRHQM